MQNQDNSFNPSVTIVGKSVFGRFFGSAEFIKLLLTVGLPVLIQQIITTVVNMMDTIMITPLGSESIAAVGQVNQFFFFFSVIIFGVNSGASIFYAQYYGRKDYVGIRLMEAIAMRLTLIIALIFSLVSFLIPEEIVRILAPDPALVVIGSEYLIILATSFFAFALTQVFGIALRSTGQAKVGMQASLLAFVFNVGLNYILIYGKLGFPALGVRGAAIATVIARIAEMIWILKFILRKDCKLVENLSELLHIDWQMFKQYLSMATPVITTETLWSLAQLLFTLAYVRIGAEASAAMQLSGTIQNIFYILTMSLASASAVVIGNAIGAGESDSDVIMAMADRILRITVAFGVLSAILQIFFPEIFLVIFPSVEPQLRIVTANLIRIRGAFIIARFLNSSIYLGIFRAGGDVRIPMLVEMLTMWIFAVPIAFIAGLYWQLGIYWTLSLVSLEEVIKLVVLFPRYRRRKWINRV